MVVFTWKPFFLPNGIISTPRVRADSSYERDADYYAVTDCGTEYSRPRFKDTLLTETPRYKDTFFFPEHGAPQMYSP